MSHATRSKTEQAPKHDVVVALKDLYEEATAAHGIFVEIARRSDVDTELVDHEADLWRKAHGAFNILDSTIDLKKPGVRRDVREATHACETYLASFRNYVVLFG